MSVTAFSRLGTANAYDNTLANLTTRQNNLANLQESLSSGKKITTPSDDPTGAAQAERALNRLSRIATDQRALEVQRNAIATAESTLGDITDALQQVRDLVVSAGNGSFSASERKTVTQQIAGLRDRILSLANSQDSNGQPLFAALGSALKPFEGPASSIPDYTFNGLPGTVAGSTYQIASALDGESAFMLQPARDVAYNVQVTPSASNLITTGVTATNSSAITGSSYAITIVGVSGSTATYTVTETDTTGATLAPVTQTAPWSATEGFEVLGLPGVTLRVKGSTAVIPNSDTITITPNSSLFATVDNAVRDIGAAPNSNASNQAVGQALHNIDISLARISSVRGQAGDLLNRADTITSTNEKRNIIQEANRSRAEDIDMMQGISDFQKQQTGYQAALQSYAQIQKLSLFNFIS